MCTYQICVFNIFWVSGSVCSCLSPFFGMFLAIFSSRIFPLCSVSSHTRRQRSTCYTDKCPMALGHSLLLFSHYFLFVVQFNICVDLSSWWLIISSALSSLLMRQTKEFLTLISWFKKKILAVLFNSFLQILSLLKLEMRASGTHYSELPMSWRKLSGILLLWEEA